MKNIALFSYNFPHKKSQDFIFHLLANGYKINIILAANPVNLNIQPNFIRTKIKHESLLSPINIATQFNIPFFVVDHNSKQTCDLLRKYEIDLAIIAGARIIRQDVIESCKIGILNFHPALLPECKGLDSFLWSIKNNLKLGVTSHLIDKGVDSGKIVQKKELAIYKDDTILDLTERIYDLQLKMLAESLELINNNNTVYIPISKDEKHNKKMTIEQELATIELFNSYIAVNATK